MRDAVLEVRSGVHRTLHEQARDAAVRVGLVEQLIEDEREHRALGCRALSVSALAERRTRRERDEVHFLATLAGHSTQPLALASEHRQSCRHAYVVVTCDVQPAEVLRRKVDVAADVNDVDTFDLVIVLKMFDGTGDHAAGDDALAETGFVGNEKPTGCRVALGPVEPIEDMVHGVALERLQPAHHRIDVDTAHNRPPINEWWASQTFDQSSSNPSGNRSCSSPCSRT
ncbi:hypothetical protein [Microbacterium aerolatum]|uniref:hypothetical protein n=1 Tax=Microbacterium aerolatum TaxID=153731 RepID=UPI001C98EBC4|nr:hypothetical protein [Microbacterium aerolatum]